VLPVRPRRPSNSPAHNSTQQASTTAAQSAGPVLLSTSSTPSSSAYPSAYPTEDEDEDVARGKKIKIFIFLELPSELRNKIYGYIFTTTPTVIDLDPDNWRKIHRSIAIFCVSKQLHDEASHHFFSTHTIRLFPTHPGRFFKTKKPLLARIAPRYRGSITSLELRLGPGFTNPPRGWIVNEALGLGDTTSVRVLKVMVEVDTSDPIFKGFRRGDDGFYENFSKELLLQVLASVPSIIEIQFDAYPSVSREGNMMKALLNVARERKKLISWGPERGWTSRRDEEWQDVVSAGLPALGMKYIDGASAEVVSTALPTLDINYLDGALAEVAIAA
jgi:hypothetical protein